MLHNLKVSNHSILVTQSFLVWLIGVFIYFLFPACTQHQNQKYSNPFAPKVFETSGYIVPGDSISNPKEIPAGNPEKVLAGKPKVLYTNTNIHLAGLPKVVICGSPRVLTPGQDTFSLPRTVPAIEHPLLAGVPEIVTAKDAYIKDQNPHNFSSYSKLQGMKHDLLRSMIQDKKGNLWFGTYGGGVSKFDGKSFTHYTEKEGLSSNSVLSILQDKNGDIWFGTIGGGVSKFDGKYFTNFTEKEGLNNNSILSLFQDHEGNLWLGTYGGGVSKYDGKNFTHFTEKEGLSNNSVLAILEDQSGNFWFGTVGGVSKYDGKTFTHYTVKEGLSNNIVSAIIEDHIGNLWFGTDGGVSKYDGKSFTIFTEKEGLSNNRVFSILEDRKGNLWFGTFGNGVSKYDGKYFTHFTEKEGLSNNDVFSILQDRNGTLWFGTNGGGVSKYDGNCFTHFTEREGLSKNNVYSICSDQNGNLWFGTDGRGISEYDGKCFKNYTEKEGLSLNNVYSILQDKNGNFWFGTYGGGVSKYDGKYFTHFTVKEGLCSNSVLSIVQDKNGNLWFGTDGGGASKLTMSTYQGSAKYTFTNFTEKEGLSNNGVLSMIEDQNGNFWFGTNGGGVSKLTMNGDEGSIKYTFTHFTEKEGLGNNRVFCITEDKTGNLWFGTDGGGVSKLTMIKGSNQYTFTNFNEKEGLSNNCVFSVLQDKNETLWFGTRFGLNKLSPLSLAMCFPKSTDEIIVKNNRHPILFKNYTYEDGFLGIGCNLNSICEDHKGIIWIGTNDRLSAYNPEGDETDTMPPDMQLTGIELFNENIAWANLESKVKNRKLKEKNVATDTSFILGNGVVVSDFYFNETTKWYGLPTNLSLRYNNNFLTFKYIGITQKQSKKVNYQYKLEGIDENWTGPTLRNEASYANLSHGTYIFRVKCMNSDGYWSKEYTYTFSIRPPWWKTWWFRLIFITFIIVCLFGFYLWRITTLKKQKKQLEQIIEEKTAVVVHQKEVLQTINRKLFQQKEEILVQNEEIKNQRDELQMANATKDKFFGIIAHDLKGPFNTLIGFSTLLIENYQDMDDKKRKEYINQIGNSSEHGLQLLLNLLEWSRSQTNRIKINPVQFELRSFIDNIFDLLAASASNKGLQFINEIHPPTYVFADVDMINTVLRNLVSNAIKYSNTGGKITISAQITDTVVQVSISDTGVGIPSESLDLLFTIDQNPSTRGTQNEKGTGLGLILCNEFVKKNNGEIWVESEVGKGSKFSFTLPKNKE